MNSIDTNILRFCKDNNLSDDTYQKLRYFIHSILSNPYYQSNPIDLWNNLLFFDNSEMETDKDHTITYHTRATTIEPIYIIQIAEEI